jgi:cytochrome P450
VKKGSWYKTLDISAGAPSVQMEIHKPTHALRRRFLAPAFSQQALKDAESLITFSATKLSQNLSRGGEKDWSEPKNMNDWATYFGFDFISDLGYGKSFGMLDEEGGNRWIPSTLKSASIFLYYVGYLPFIDLVRPLMGSKIQEYISKDARDSLRYTEMANSRLAARMELEDKLRNEGKEGGRKDTFHYLLNSKDAVTGKTFTKERRRSHHHLSLYILPPP